MRSRATWLLAVAALAACENGGAGRTIGITANGIVRGQVFFDANGSRTFDAGDVGIAGARVGLLAPGGGDTLFHITAGPDGRFRVAGVPVGRYTAVVDSASAAGDSAVIVGAVPATLVVAPDDSVEFVGVASYPLFSTAQVRAATPGTRVFVRAIALHARETFSDTTLHVVDAAGALRATRVRPSTPAVATGDSVVLRGRVASRLGQAVLDDVTAFIISPTLVPGASSITTLAGTTAGAAGALDAALVGLLDVLVTDTATVASHLQLTVDDGSGPLVVILDRAADVGFRPPLPPNLYVPGNRFDLFGILVPTGTGSWRLKPRSALDLTLR